MLELNERGYCLVSQQIRSEILNGQIKVSGNMKLNKKGRFVDKALESRVQPSSFEPVTTDKIYTLDIGSEALFRPTEGIEISSILDALVEKKRTEHDISNGFQINKGFAYLLPLDCSVRLKQDAHIKSSPKSARGREFFKNRLLSDYNPGFNMINSVYGGLNKEIHLWLLLQPLAFNGIIYPGIAFNQLRFFNGLGAKLSSLETLREFEREPFAFTTDANRNRKPTRPIITEEGFQIHLDAIGRETGGVIALRARQNPEPLDLRKENEYNVEGYFDPITRKDLRRVIKAKEYYLLASKEFFSVPPHLSAELRRYSDIGFVGPQDFAGFIDNGFKGDIVYEPRSDEFADVELNDNMPMTTIEFFRTIVEPEKKYGGESGAHFQGQVGITPSKRFKPIDYKRLLE